MATNTPNLDLRQPAGTDYVQVLQDISNNMEKIDNTLGQLKNQSVANNLTTTAAGSVLDARQGKLLNDNFIQYVNSISALNSLISSMPSGGRTLALFYGDVTSALVDHNAASNAIISKMDAAGTADMMIFSLGGNYAGTIRYTPSNSTVTKKTEFSSYEQASWTPKLYDYETYLRDLPTWVYFKIGNLVIAPFRWEIAESVTFSTMIQIRNLPCRTVLGGTIYIAQLGGQGADMTFQGNVSNGYVRPNFSGTLSGGWFTGMIIGYNW